ncbi:MAG TPA: TIGR02147 family protein, partial [Bdellovibrionales bacterium]|nr:TIGR02147 family protein [Bdellovibrionales bacterium]
KTGEINQDTWEKVPSWVAWVLHALTDQKDVSADFESLYGHLRRKAKPDVVRKSLERLMESGELARGEDGSLQKGRLLMSGSENVPVDLVRKIQSELIYLGLESLAQDPPQDREFGAMTVALTEEEFENLKFELRQFRKRWTKDIMVKRQESKGDRVFQLNIQLFPVSEK